MSYKRKTVDRWDIMTNYGYGWEAECSEYTRKEALQRLKEYRENIRGSVRLEKHREKTANNKPLCITLSERDGEMWDGIKSEVVQ